MFRERCLTSQSTNLKEIINLGMHPLADSFIPESYASNPDRIYPLVCQLCPESGQIQLKSIVDPLERYTHVDYSYTSSNSNFSRKHWINYAREVRLKAAVSATDAVVEIGSNDGFLTSQFKQSGCVVLGIDPSPAMAELASERDVDTVVALFSSGLVDQVVDQLGRKPKLIVANNVFNHADDPLAFAEGIRDLLDPDGTFVFELPYWYRTVKDLKFDQIYHEHVTYFTATYADFLFRSVGMTVVDVEEVNYHGGSIRVYVRHQNDRTSNQSEALERFVNLEKSFGLFDEELYAKFMEKINSARYNFLGTIFDIKSGGGAIVCAGAAAKGNTFLNYYRLDNTLVDYVTDASPNKIGKYTPGTRIPIESDDILSEYGRVSVIVTSWNLMPELGEKLKAFNDEIEFLNPYPESDSL